MKKKTYFYDSLFFNNMELCILNNQDPLNYDRQIINQTIPTYLHKIKRRQMHFRNCLVEPLVDCHECNKFIKVYVSFVKKKCNKYEKNNRRFEFFKQQNKKKYSNLQVEINNDFCFENRNTYDFSNACDDL
jgi:hypothetical protein